MLSRVLGDYSVGLDPDGTQGESEPLIPAPACSSSDPTLVPHIFPAHPAQPLGGLAPLEGAGQEQQELDFLRPSLTPTVESAEEILQAVEAQLEQSPLLSRRSSMSMAMRSGRTGRAPTGSGGGTSLGLSLGSPPAVGAAGLARGTVTPSATSPPPGAIPMSGSSVAASATSRASSLGGAPQSSTNWQHQQHYCQQQQSQQHPPQHGPVSGCEGVSLIEQYLHQVAAAAAAAVAAEATHAQARKAPSAAATAATPGATAAPGGGGVADASASRLGAEPLASTASFSSDLIDRACDAVVAASTEETVGSAAAAVGWSSPPGAPTPAGPAVADAVGGCEEGGRAGALRSRDPSEASLPEDAASSRRSVPSVTAAVSEAAAGASRPGLGGGPEVDDVAAQRRYASMSALPPPTRVLPVSRGRHDSASLAPGAGLRPPAAAAGNVLEKKVAIAGVRTWLKVLPDGSASIVQLDRAQLGLRYGVQLRDFRVLDPVLGATYPACLLCREGALIVNLDHIKVIITAHFALVNHADSDKTRPFNEELKRRLHQYTVTKALAALAPSERPAPAPPAVASAAGNGIGAFVGSSVGGSEGGTVNPTFPRFPSSSTLDSGSAVPMAGSRLGPARTPWTMPKTVSDAPPAPPSAHVSVLSQGPIAHVASAIKSILPNVRGPGGSLLQQSPAHPSFFPPPAAGGQPSGEGPQVSELVASMPFELRALEVVLEQTVSLLDCQTTELERATRMALDELTLRVNPRNLERMRHLKGRMATLSNKVDTVRSVLEKLLDDDRAMAAMNLTAREEQLEAREAAAAQVQAAVSAARERDPSQLSAPSALYPASSGSLLTPLEMQQLVAMRGGSPPAFGRLSSQLGSGGGPCGGVTVGYHDGGDPDDEEVAVVEMLLEAYFMQLGHTWQRLQSLKSYIDSTEDLINLELDQQRNNLISVDLMVTFASFLLTAMSVIAGLFGMNVTNRLEADYSAFLAICIGSAAAAVTLWLLFVYCSIRYGLMNGLSMTWR